MESFDYTVELKKDDYDCFWRYHVINVLANFTANPYESSVNIASLPISDFCDLLVDGKLANGNTELLAYVNVGRVS